MTLSGPETYIKIICMLYFVRNTVIKGEITVEKAHIMASDPEYYEGI